MPPSLSYSAVEKRLERLEKDFSGPPRGPGVLGDNGDGGDDADRLRRKFISGFCHAISHVRRAEIDRGEVWGYSIETTLRNGSPFSVACYLSALRHMGHEDEAEAREVLAGLVEERGLDARPLERLMHLVEQLRVSRDPGEAGT